MPNPSHQLLNRTRLDRFISKALQVKRSEVRLMLASGRILVDGQAAESISQVVHTFSHICLDGDILLNNTPQYLMMNKPVGVVSATKDAQHKTVMDLLRGGSLRGESLQGESLNGEQRAGLHIAGRLDFNSSGLLLLTNDGHWSRRLSAPETRVSKAYRVTLEDPIEPHYVEAFAEGMYFAFEDLTTRPARLHILSEHLAEVYLTEGRYHQIKRMFGRFNNKVTSLHRFAIGGLYLDEALQAGQSRGLSADELERVF
ncbi:MAG: 16S rRNA pseudouridine(516) synthase [Alteromonadaceae bacterium]|nr:MAG: 16S rRNA pseudouridine(516) synthase [Alteromonadaceae bacterium]